MNIAGGKQLVSHGQYSGEVRIFFQKIITKPYHIVYRLFSLTYDFGVLHHITYVVFFVDSYLPR